ncbi:hypothetical protein [Nannocystis pusilla]|uniref:hypothetical protein n=1 Tax=Nannocystis pusilla TaxID=889268 RepID=UPI003B801FDF
MDKVKSARAGGKPAMLRFLNAEPGCWKSKAESAKLKTYAYKELEKWKECARAGRGQSDADVVKWVKFCERREARWRASPVLRDRAGIKARRRAARSL